MAKHRKPSNTKKNIQRASTATLGGVAAIAISTASAPGAMASPLAWDVIAQCESGNSNVENSGPSTASGFFQIIDSTWAGAGGLEFAPRAIDATFDQQAIVAQRIAERRGSLADWNASKGCWGDQIPSDVPTDEIQEVAPEVPAPVAPEASTDTVTVQPEDYLSKIALELGTTWQELYQINAGVIGPNPDLIHPGQVFFVGGLPLENPPVTLEEETKVEEQSSGEESVDSDVVAVPVTGDAFINNSAGPVSQRAQSAADSVFSNVLGASLIDIGGTRASAIDPHGHPSGNALDYMVLGDSALGDSIVQYHIDNWDALGVEYIIWQQRILMSPGGSWEQMEDRGSATQNHMDHVHVNYR